MPKDRGWKVRDQSHSSPSRRRCQVSLASGELDMKHWQCLRALFTANTAPEDAPAGHRRCHDRVGQLPEPLMRVQRESLLGNLPARKSPFQDQGSAPCRTGNGGLQERGASSHPSLLKPWAPSADNDVTQQASRSSLNACICIRGQRSESKVRVRLVVWVGVRVKVGVVVGFKVKRQGRRLSNVEPHLHIAVERAGHVREAAARHHTAQQLLCVGQRQPRRDAEVRLHVALTACTTTDQTRNSSTEGCDEYSGGNISFRMHYVCLWTSISRISTRAFAYVIVQMVTSGSAQASRVTSRHRVA